MTTGQLQDLLIARLVRDHGGTRQKWRKLIGNVHLYDRKTHPHCNWAINCLGSRSEVEAIEGLIDDIRNKHPLVSPER
ncbi:hypothetical protein [Sphingobium sp. WCS2017Hpa-17]|uniref:hypothetical protein n=1 Tax=Sphingobium sp. WCS2017Hpa-17 TaxID=3073638 RepID=UPI00288AA6F6|nr:hypothetical protein [Sphingobium sp. WCS2017Hpa-17]